MGVTVFVPELRLWRHERFGRVTPSLLRLLLKLEAVQPLKCVAPGGQPSATTIEGIHGAGDVCTP